jgi:hypothetical protein
MNRSFINCILLLIISCTSKTQQEQSVNPTDIDAISFPATDTLKTALNVTTNDSVITVKFLKDSIAATVSGVLKMPPQHVIVNVDIKQGKQLFAILHTHGPNANIRINQVVTPDGKADGPFGKSVIRPILKQGMYKLIIGHNLMADGASEGKFDLRVIIK